MKSKEKRNQIKKTILFSFLLLILMTACERILFEPDKASSDPFDNFLYLWEEVDKKYSYFELKQIDWDQIKIDYYNKLNADMSEEELFTVLADMLNELRDDHVNLFSPFNISRYNVALQHKKNYHGRTIEEYYVPNMRITGAFRHNFITGTDIAYIRYSSFMNMVTSPDLDHLHRLYRNTDGIILDLRENGGGNMFMIPTILERFAHGGSGKMRVAYSITRNGPGRNDFSKPVPFYVLVKPEEKTFVYQKIAVLIDRGSYSATTFFALATKTFDNVTLIGDTTGGGGGMPNGGQLPNGWTYRFSITQMLDFEYKNYAEDGVPPDIYAEFDWTDLTKDEILEKAIQKITSN